MARKAVSGESVASLIELALASGHDVSKDQLTRWHRRGLLPRPRQISRGSRGSEVIYPGGTGDLLLALLEVRSRFRSLNDIGWTMWWEGQPVPDSLGREALERLVRKNLEQIGVLMTPEGELTEAGHKALDGASGAIDSGVMRRARRRHGVEDFDLLLQNLLLLVSGHLDQLKDSDLAELEHALAIDKGRTDPLPATGRGWIEGDIRTDFENIAHLNDPHFQLEALDAATNEGLRQLRDLARQVLATVVNLGGVLAETAGPSAFGYASFARDFAELDKQPDGQAYILLAVLAASSAGLREGVEMTAAQLPETERLVAQHEILRALRDDVPELRPIITNRRLGAAMKSKVVDQALQRDIAATRAYLAPQIDAFFAAHPEFVEIIRKAEEDS